jgi:sortase A
VTAGDRVRWFLRGIGQLLITAGVVILLFCVYELKVTNLYTDRQQDSLDRNLEQQWASSAPTGPTEPTGPELTAYPKGKGIARIYLPSVDPSYVRVVVEGIGHNDLRKGPGHYPGTDGPGALGNMVISGHRTTYGAPFNRLDELEVGAPIVIETQGFFYTYRVLRQTIVKPNAIGETDHVPYQAGARPTQRLLTLTTCNPKYSARTRLIIRAVLEAPLAKGPGVVPPALRGA